MTATVRHWTLGQWALRATMVAGVLGGLLSTGAAGAWPRWWLVLLVLGLAVAYAALPETSIGTVAMGLVLGWWGLAFSDGLQWQVLVAAAALLAAHVAGLLVSYGPDRLPVDPATVRLWVRRGLLVLLLSPAAYLLAAWVRDQPEPPTLWVTGLAAGVGAVGLASVLLAAGRARE